MSRLGSFGAVTFGPGTMDRRSSVFTPWGLFRDRRPELYGALLTLDGATRGEAVA
ncbi:uncharacterized protein SOCE26_103320 [Sorangium cellulosum]|uniref:Uncharacterized protein n=1 Tax=Sorangium cellulosum TaxID=56 RepID=A0A2L0FB88_SORCE|nr:hypothetical protein [Sorangium cellulosum]AUX48791.1 uncharacterized protein SOCE26_103320 [Sorangium cellulosum]